MVCGERNVRAEDGQGVGRHARGESEKLPDGQIAAQ